MGHWRCWSCLRISFSLYRKTVRGLTEKKKINMKNPTFLKLNVFIFSLLLSIKVCVWRVDKMQIISILIIFPGFHIFKYIYQTSFLWANCLDTFFLFCFYLKQKKKQEESYLVFWKVPKPLAYVSMVSPQISYSHAHYTHSFYSMFLKFPEMFKASPWRDSSATISIRLGVYLHTEGSKIRIMLGINFIKFYKRWQKSSDWPWWGQLKVVKYEYWIYSVFFTFREKRGKI